MNSCTTAKAGFVALTAAGCVVLLAGCGGGNKGQYTDDAQAMPTYRYPPANPPPNQVIYRASSNAPAAGGQPVAAGQQETIPPSPGPGYIWMPGYWSTSSAGGWEWVSGHYVTRERMSDEQLRAARGMLEQARLGASDKARKRVDEAIDEINTALKGK